MPDTSRPNADIRVAAVRVSGFRVLRDVCVTLDPGTTVLVGENNTGKSAFLEALATAMGTRQPVPDDLHIDADGRQHTEFMVDLLLVPAEGRRFSPQLDILFRDAIRVGSTHDNVDDRDLVAIRTIGTIGADRSTVDRRRCFIEGWWGCDKSGSTQVVELPRLRVTERHLAPISFVLLSADRDLVAEMRRRTSRWGRLLAQRDLDQETEDQIEDQLRELGSRILKGSPLLGRLRDHLNDVQQALATIEKVELEPLPSRVDDLARATDVIVTAPRGPRLPLRMQGLGSRSVAELMVYQAFIAELAGAAEPFSPHVLACFEEPETHLHPQAQTAVLDIIDQAPGQRIATTHSPQVVGTVDLEQVRLFRHSDSGVEVTRCGKVDQEARIRTRRFTKSYGQVFFARMVVMGDGATEHAALPVFAKARWGREPESMGVTFVDPGSLGQAQPLIKALDDLGIPWLALVDADTAGYAALRGIGNRIGRTLDEDSPEVVMLPDGANFEEYLLLEGYQVALKRGLEEFYGAGTLARYSKRRNLTELSEDDQLADFLKDNKGTYGAAVAEAIVATGDDGAPRIPERIAELLRRADRILGIGSS